MNFQVFILDLEKAEEPHCQHPLDHQKSKRVPEKKNQKNINFCFIHYAKSIDCVDHKKLWKILKEVGIPDNLIFLLRNLYAGQESTFRTGHQTTAWFQIRKGVYQDVYSHPAHLTYMESTS